MAQPRFLALLLVMALLALSFSQGVVVEGRKVQVMRAVRRYGRRQWRSPLLGRRLLPQREEATAYTLMDYGPPTANTNTHGGMVPSQDPTSPPTH
ncbi:uncharacterized protein LOC133901920 [Phragmites australis]|uniref:uncharacterized protein LOC133901920 n=1 Tax=Phragmites australis TaxID=29695 RepID=UPI002D786AF3|nr:uncharacterized protein LOC133901920 [Phragmites australis]